MKPRTKTDPKQLSPLTSVKGTLSLTKYQCDFFLNLLAAIPSKGEIAIHKSRIIAVAGPQLQDWETCRIDLIKEYAVTSLINSETPEAGCVVDSYTQAEVDSALAQAKSVALASNAQQTVEIPVVGQAKFESPERQAAFAAAFDQYTKSMLVVWDVASQANIRKGLAACLAALTDARCPAIADTELMLFERLVEEIEVAVG